MKKAKKKAKRAKKMVTMPLHFNREQAQVFHKMARDCDHPVETVCEVLIAAALHAAGNSTLQGAIARQSDSIAELQTMLARCRNVMEANDPGNARDIFGEPAAPPCERCGGTRVVFEATACTETPCPLCATPTEGAPTVP